jgi:hypothetical protein
MNYLLNRWFILIISLYLLLAIFLTYALASFLLKIFFRLKPQYKNENILSINFISFLVVFGLSACLGWVLYYQLSDGAVKELYILNSRITVWLDLRLKTFDLKSGKFMGQADLLKWRKPSRDYQIFGPVDNKAWGYSRENGLALLDMVKPERLADEKDILEKNPQLGETFSPRPGDYVYDPITYSIQVIAQDGSLFRVDSNLVAAPVRNFTSHSPGRKKTGKHWTFDQARQSAGETVREIGAPSSNSKKTVLLLPEFIHELNQKAAAKSNKVWVLHFSALYGDQEPLLSYMDSQGREINRINLHKLFNDKKTKPVATLVQGNETLVFITKRGFTLTALRTDSITGKILGRIEYIK